MFLPNRWFIIGDEDFFSNSQPSVISAALVRMASVFPPPHCSMLEPAGGQAPIRHRSQLPPWAGAAGWWHPCPPRCRCLPLGDTLAPAAAGMCLYRGRVLGEEWAGEGGEHPGVAGMSPGTPGAGFGAPEPRGRGAMQEEWHVILDCSLQACWLRMCKNNN